MFTEADRQIIEEAARMFGAAAAEARRARRHDWAEKNMRKAEHMRRIGRRVAAQARAEAAA